MRTQLRDLVASALYPTKAHNLPSVCERYGLEPGDGNEAFSSKTQYVMRRLMKLSDEQVLKVAKEVIKEFPDDRLQSAIENIEKVGHILTDITRDHLAKALNGIVLSGEKNLIEFLAAHWPSIYSEPSRYNPLDGALYQDIQRHAVRNDDWENSEILELVGFFTCSQSKVFQFLEAVLHPRYRSSEEQERLVAALNEILLRDGYRLVSDRKISGYPSYKIQETTPTGSHPADEIISQGLESFDETAVHVAWQKALARRSSDPEGAITAAKTLLETVCKHIVEEMGGHYDENADLTNLYNETANILNLAPGQHTEKTFKAILGNCQSVVGYLANIRNKLGDSHGQGKRAVRPLPRHAELAVNLAGAMALFLVSTLHARRTS